MVVSVGCHLSPLYWTAQHDCQSQRVATTCSLGHVGNLKAYIVSVLRYFDLKDDGADDQLPVRIRS